MDGKTLNVLLIEDNPDYTELVQHWLSAAGEGVAYILNWTDSLAAGMRRLSQGGIDVILLDLGLPDCTGVETFTSTRAYAPGIPIIVLSAGDSESLALQMIQEGADDYLVKSTCNAELLLRAIRYAIERHRWQGGRNGTEASPDRARAIGIIGAKGGVGASTVACILAAELRRQTDQKVLLADMDSHAGLVSFLMGVDPKYSILDAISNIHHLDQSCWDGIVARGANDVHIISSPALLGNGEVHAHSLANVLTLVRPFYQWIVLDLGRLNGMSMNLLNTLDEVYVVTTTGIPALYEAKRVIDALGAAGIEGDRLRLIVNQTEEFIPLSGSELNKIFGIHVYAKLPRDSQALHNACIQRRLPGESTNIGKQIANLARKVARLRDKKPRRSLPQFRSFVEMFRKSPDGASDAHAE
jgi:Flp pilus assembly CpaE family ATPase